MFHVETTAWEGEHAYEALAEPEAPKATEKTPNAQEKPADDKYASYGSYFWSKN